ncbi:hypothetical protein [Bradyrhizobium cenepequi]|uniref:hypothetical protein n=1 Tax=Bradyrhizobium cenepequi TaxID=2821403 RepID=UPI001CE242DB|nr:hypothetical protein [Bradyrhizobium cenepequi]MCA6107346.1 hypothetical protein [Bradyrhizobium cenepequi]
MIRLIAGSACKVREHKGSASIATAPPTKILRLTMAIPLRHEDSWNNSPTRQDAAFNKPLRQHSGPDGFSDLRRWRIPE